VGVGGSFFKFPRKLTYVEFSVRNGRTALDVWSKDGQQVGPRSLVGWVGGVGGGVWLPP
jgi:hypothetical protein